MRATEDSLADLHGLVAEKLMEKLRSGDATAAEFGQAIKFLKDNGIESLASGDSALKQLEEELSQQLPFSNSQDPLSH